DYSHTTSSTSQNGNVATSQLPNVGSVTRGDNSSVVLYSGNPSQTDLSSRNATATTSASSLPAPSVPQTNSGENTDNSNVNTSRKRKSTAATTSRSRKPKAGTSTNVETTMVASSSATQISTQFLGAEPSSMASELGQQLSGQAPSTSQKKPIARKPRAKKTPAVAVDSSNSGKQAPHENAHVAAPFKLGGTGPLENANGVSAALAPPPPATNPAIVNQYSGQDLRNSLASMAANGYEFWASASNVFMNPVVPVPAHMQVQPTLNNNSNNNNCINDFATAAQGDAGFNFNFDEVIGDAANADIGTLETEVPRPAAQTDLTSIDNAGNHFWEHLWNASTEVTDLLNQPLALPPLNNSVQNMPDLASTRQKRRQEDDGQNITKKHRTSQN
ncbi:hypothetical protein HDU76_010863, partial [Blyttiomyces sp. JEL0837]